MMVSHVNAEYVISIRDARDEVTSVRVYIYIYDGVNHCYRRNLLDATLRSRRKFRAFNVKREQTNIIERRESYTRNSSSLNPDISRSGKYVDISF